MPSKASPADADSPPRVSTEAPSGRGRGEPSHLTGPAVRESRSKTEVPAMCIANDSLIKKLDTLVGEKRFFITRKFPINETVIFGQSVHLIVFFMYRPIC